MNTQPTRQQVQIDEIGSDFNIPLWKNFVKDVRAMSKPEDPHTVRELVKAYYRIQDARIAIAAQSRDLSKFGKPNELNEHIANNMKYMEQSLIEPFQYFTSTYVVGRWALSQYGIGPVITAGLLSNIDISKAHTAGSIWRFAGMDPTVVWNKGEKRPWNADLKVLVWKIGQSFMKFHNRPACFYGKLYAQDKARRTEANQAGAYADRAKHILETKDWKKDNSTKKKLLAGFLPDAQIDAQARRFAAKIFLSHFHTVWYEDYHTQLQGTPVCAPRPYAIQHGGHAHMIEIPNYVQAVSGRTPGYILSESN